MTKSTFTIKTFGCKVNQYEEQLIRERVSGLGLEESKTGEADLFIVNSCTVTGEADKKTERFIRRVKRENPNAKILVTGCYAVLERDIKKLESFPEISMVVPGNEKMKIPDILSSFCDVKTSGNTPAEGVSGLSGHTRAFLKVQDGCDQTCSYCKVNIVRGPSVSKSEEDVLSELGRLIEKGYKEIVLTGICLGSWEGSGGEKLDYLLRKIERLEGDFRVRLSSIEPNHIDHSLIDIIASSSKICSHLHIPLQSGSDRVLKMMNRRYDRGDFESIVRTLRDVVPLCGVSMDIIAGFPGETDRDFQDTEDFVEKIRPSRLHVFKYSAREGTRSFDMPDKVPQDIAKKRVEDLIKLGDKLESEFCHKFIGQEVEVLVEHKDQKGICEGYSSEYIRVQSDILEPFQGKIAKFCIDNVDKSGPFAIPRAKC